MAELDPTSWTCSSNEALYVSVAEPQGAFTFKPKFTYPIFGDAEQIFGYKDLRIDLAFDCKSLKPFLNYRYSSKISDDVKDINDQLLAFLPDSGKDAVLKSEEKWLDSVDDEKFEIPGECVGEYELNMDIKNTYKIYKFKPVESEEGLKLHRRMQIFVLLYIEAGSYIDENDPIWDVYCIYKCPKDGSKETFVGFATTYAYWKYPGHEIYDSSEKQRYRKKISQFIILPPFQGKHHGQHLYSTIVSEWLKDDSVEEITVEDPSEAFDDLRDRCDMERLLFERGFLDSLDKLPVSEEWIEERRKVEKMEPRQFDRCVEMGLFYLLKRGDSRIENLNEKEIRLLVKKRLFRKNRDALVELEKADMRDKLQTAYQRIRGDYERILGRLRRGVKRSANEPGTTNEPRTK
ncbi:DEKNAAC102057 [Brettanomyces naardenensis]|uniref:Histone acetyltransferase type B catalytic subunit n=1 Tax=Brettanomyces naardenensis TaxID=13370 RepID=A0A448YJK6_BRENA|nr:DEKNAAC102057 [Brettanomyces naardenensis]